MALPPKYKKMIETVLDIEVRAGYRPVFMIFPIKMGCRVCSIQKKGTEYTVTVIGKRIEPRKIYLWSIVTVCSKCKKREEGPNSTVVKMMMYRWSEGMIEEENP